MRPRLMEPSSPDQAAFHEAFADVVALLSVFSIPEVLEEAVRQATRSIKGGMLRVAGLTSAALQEGMLFGLGEQYGDVLSGVHGSSLRRSVRLTPSRGLLDRPEYQEEHRRGEILVAAMLHAFMKVYRDRLETLGKDAHGRLPAVRMAEEGADVASRMLTMSIRALDYLPPTDLEFGDVLSALITSDLELRPDDSRYRVRDALRASFESFGIRPTSAHSADGEFGCWEPPQILRAKGAKQKRPLKIDYEGVHRESIQRDPDEVFRFLWENRKVLGLCEEAYTRVAAVGPFSVWTKMGSGCGRPSPTTSRFSRFRPENWKASGFQARSSASGPRRVFRSAPRCACWVAGRCCSTSSGNSSTTSETRC